MFFQNDVSKFLLGFMGMIFLGLSLLIAVGFYKSEISGGKNTADTSSGFYRTADFSN